MNITVFCGARPGNDPSLMQLARDLGAGAAARGIGIVYGGAAAGLMGAVADGALDGDGVVIGIIPQGLLSWEVGHQGITEMRVAPTMHVRKQHMMEAGDAYLVLPGGIGTIDEIFEVLIAQQLGFESKPLVLIGPARSWTPLLALFEPLVTSGFAGPVAIVRAGEPMPVDAEMVIGRADGVEDAYALVEQWRRSGTRILPDATAVVEGGEPAIADGAIDASLDGAIDTTRGVPLRDEEAYVRWRDQVVAQERAQAGTPSPADLDIG